MTRKANKTTTGWRKRYAVTAYGRVFLVRGNGKKHNKKVLHQAHISGRWQWVQLHPYLLVDTEAQLVALRLQGVPVSKEPRWTTYSS